MSTLTISIKFHSQNVSYYKRLEFFIKHISIKLFEMYQSERYTEDTDMKGNGCLNSYIRITKAEGNVA